MREIELIHLLQTILIAVLALGSLVGQAFRVHRPPFLRIIASIGWLLLVAATLMSLTTAYVGHTRSVLFASLTLIASVEASLALSRWTHE